jgi:hypothetical protein
VFYDYTEKTVLSTAKFRQQKELSLENQNYIYLKSRIIEVRILSK